VLAEDYALSFDGVDDYVEIANNTAWFSGDYTIVARVRFADLSKDNIIMSLGYNNTPAILFQMRSVASSFSIQLGEWDGSYNEALRSPSLTIDTGTIYDVAVTRSGNSLSAFLDVAPQDTGTSSGIDPIGVDYHIGHARPRDNMASLFSGDMHFVAVYNRALSTTDLQDIKNDTVDTDDSSLLACYIFNNGSAEDVSGNNRDGTVVGASFSAIAGSYSETGTRTAPTIDLSTLGTASETSTISWQATDNSQTITIETALSTDGGTTWGTWQAATNGGSIPGITAGMDLSTAQLKCRQTLSTTDTSVTPQLHSLTITVREQSLISGVYTVGGEFVERTVRAHRRSDGAMLAESTVSSTDGTYSFDVGSEEECYLVFIDTTAGAYQYVLAASLQTPYEVNGCSGDDEVQSAMIVDRVYGSGYDGT
jgi:hypothetical protein